MPVTAAAFERYLAQTTADAVLILGDLFEVWIGDDVEADDFSQRMLGRLVDAAQRRTVGVMVGNRDFLMSPPMLRAHGMVPLDDPALLVAFGRRFVLSHGDALCVDDHDYQRFRRMVRTPAWQASFLRQPRDTRELQARSLREASEARRSSGPVTEADAQPDLTMQWLAQAHAATIVHGHTHRPADHRPAVRGAAPETSRHVLTDWDLDHAVPRGEVLRLSTTGVQRHTVSPR